MDVRFLPPTAALADIGGCGAMETFHGGAFLE